MRDQNEFRGKASALMKAGDFAGAKRYVRAGLEENPSQADLLAIAIDLYRSLDKREKSLEYAELLIAHHPGNWIGYGRAAQDLCALGRLVEAQSKIEMGIQKLPSNHNLLIIASDVYRVSDDREKSLECAEQLITHHPAHPSGYKRRVQDLVSLGRIDDVGEAITSFYQACVRDGGSLQTCLDLVIATSKQGLVINTCEIAFHLLNLIEAVDGKTFKTLLYRAKILAIDGQVGMVGSVLEENFSNTPETLSDLKDSVVLSRKICRHDLAYRYLLIGRQVFGDSDPKFLKAFFGFLVSFGRYRDALELIEDYQSGATEGIGKLAKRDFVNSLRTVLREDLDCRPYSNETKQSLLATGFYCLMEDSNPSYSRVVQSNSEVDVLLVHVGKCAGGTVITTLRSLFPACNVKIWEYHIHDSRHLLSRVIDLQEQKANLLVLILTRDPLARFISAYNWDYCLHVLQRTPYSQFKIDRWYQKYPSARELICALVGTSACDEAITFARYKHYAYGHMRMGISWYLSIDILKKLNPFRTFCIRVEHINEDLPNFVRHLQDFSGYKTRKELWVRHNKSDYTRLFPGNLLRTDASQVALTDYETDRMKRFLSDDYKCHEYVSEKFIRARLS